MARTARGSTCERCEGIDSGLEETASVTRPDRLGWLKERRRDDERRPHPPGFTATLTLIGVVVSAVALYVTRDVWREQHQSADILREVVQISREIHEGSERGNYYLFSKLGPLDTK